MNNLSNLSKYKELGHSIYVTRLYRKSLKLVRDWYLIHSELRINSCKLRLLFKENRFITSKLEKLELIKQTEHILNIYHHPNPYIYPTAPGGSKWERNLGIPEDIIKRGVRIIDNN